MQITSNVNSPWDNSALAIFLFYFLIVWELGPKNSGSWTTKGAISCSPFGLTWREVHADFESLNLWKTNFRRFYLLGATNFWPNNKITGVDLWIARIIHPAIFSHLSPNQSAVQRLRDP